MKGPYFAKVTCFMLLDIIPTDSHGKLRKQFHSFEFQGPGAEEDVAVIDQPVDRDTLGSASKPNSVDERGLSKDNVVSGFWPSFHSRTSLKVSCHKYTVLDSRCGQASQRDPLCLWLCWTPLQTVFSFLVVLKEFV